MKFIDLFAGVGGMRLGIGQAGKSVTVLVVFEIAKRLDKITQEC